MAQKFVVPVKSFRKVEDPFDREDRAKYICYVHVKDVPQGIPMATNPREQNLNLKVPKTIRESLMSNTETFHLLNRGLVLSAQTVKYENQSRLMTVVFDNPTEHGDIDGGHTYKIILESQTAEIDQYVQFEIMTGIEEIIEPLAAARNTSSQVDDKSLAELSNKFDPIKKAIQHMPFFERIAFKQNQHTDADFKAIDAREVVAVLYMFNIDRPSMDHPITAYRSKAAVLDAYLAADGQEPYAKMRHIAPDIFKLYSRIEQDFPDAYNSAGGAYGRKKYSLYAEGRPVARLKFGNGEEMLTYKVPEGLLYPVVGAFRALVEHDATTGYYRWKKDPFAVYDSVRTQIAAKVVRFCDSVGNNPQTVGKDSTSWDMLHMTIALAAA